MSEEEEAPPQSRWSRFSQGASRMASRAKSHASNAATKANSFASNRMADARALKERIGDKSSKASTQNNDRCMAVGAMICEKGVLPNSQTGNELYTTYMQDVGDGKKAPILKITPLGTQQGMDYNEQNYQTLRKSLPSKGVKPSVSDASAMAVYTGDMENLAMLMKQHDVVRPGTATTGGGRRRSSRKKKRRTTKKRRTASRRTSRR